jgi:hypothetical protein
MFLGSIIAVEVHNAPTSSMHPLAAGLALPPQAATAPDHTTAWVATILARPLFSRSRRPPAIAAETRPGLPRLSGITISPAGKRAIFAPAGGKPIIAREGDHVGVFTIRSISADRVIITGPGGIIVLGTTFSGAKAGARPAG